MKTLQNMNLEELWQLFPIVLKEHNPFYCAWYGEEKEKLFSVFPEACRISHIGSTAVNGLTAKPIVDILLELPETYSVNASAALLEKAGWQVMMKKEEEKTLDLNKGYTLQGFAEKVYHLHVKPSGDWNELYFRDYLQKYPEIARQYETLKLCLWKQFEHNRDAYTDGKAEFVNRYSQMAREEFGSRYAPNPPKDERNAE